MTLYEYQNKMIHIKTNTTEEIDAATTIVCCDDKPLEELDDIGCVDGAGVT